MPDKQLDQKTIDHICQIAKLELTQEEKSKYAEELDGILEAFKLLEELGADTEPAFHSVHLADAYREDVAVPTEWSPLQNARQTEGNYFKGPKIV